jgi:hypothetical protein
MIEWSTVPRFPLTAECPLGRVRFTVGGRRYRATLSCVDGHIFDLAITPSPKTIAFANWDSEPTAELLVDPLTPGHTVPPETVPETWLDILRTMTPQATAAGWTLHDAKSTRRLPLDEGEFIVLAERDGDEFLLHRAEPRSAALFWLASHDGTPEPLRGDIGRVLCTSRNA